MRQIDGSLTLAEVFRRVNDPEGEGGRGGGGGPIAAITAPIGDLEMRSYLRRLDDEGRIMVSWDSGMVYVV